MSEFKLPEPIINSSVCKTKEQQKNKFLKIFDKDYNDTVYFIQDIVNSAVNNKKFREGGEQCFKEKPPYQDHRGNGDLKPGFNAALEVFNHQLKEQHGFEMKFISKCGNDQRETYCEHYAQFWRGKL